MIHSPIIIHTMPCVHLVTLSQAEGLAITGKKHFGEVIAEAFQASYGANIVEYWALRKSDFLFAVCKSVDAMVKSSPIF